MTKLALQPGLHFNELFSSYVLSPQAAARGAYALAAVNDAHMLGVLQRQRGQDRLDTVAFKERVTYPCSECQDGRWVAGLCDADGQYHPDTRFIEVKAELGPADAQRQVGHHHTVAQLAPTLEEAVTRTLAHEIAHHIARRLIPASGTDAQAIERAFQSAVSERSAVSPYALERASDYWAETVTALIYEPALQASDPDGWVVCAGIWHRL